MVGVFGCNGFGESPDDPYEFSDGVLIPGEVVSEAAGCVPESLMLTELAFRDAVWSNQTIEVETSGGTM